MSDSPINIGGMNFGSPKPVQAAQSEPAREQPPKQPGNNSREPEREKPQAKKQQPEPHPKEKRTQGFYGIATTARLTNGNDLCYLAWTDTHDDMPYRQAEVVTSFGKPLTDVSFGLNGKTTLRYANSITVNNCLISPYREELARRPRYSRLLGNGGLFLNFRKSWKAYAVPELAIIYMKKKMAEGISILDVAVDSNEAWVVIAANSVTWSEGIDEQLAEKLTNYAERGNPVLSIPHFEGDSWFIRTKTHWYSSNLPQELYKSLPRKEKVHAIAIAPNGGWLVQWEQKPAVFAPMPKEAGEVFKDHGFRSFNDILREMDEKRAKSS